METPAKVDFQGASLNEHVQQSVLAHISALERRFGRITACRIAVTAPSGHHHSGGQYEIAVRLALPDGREVNVDRTASADERFADPTFAINDAFRRARRCLQDEVRRMRGEVKLHAAPPLATIARIDAAGGYGFLATADGREVYFHRNSVLDGGFEKLAAGTRVAFVEEQGEKGPQASTVRIAGKRGPRSDEVAR